MVRLREEGRIDGDIARLVGVGTSTVSRIVLHHEKTGSLEPLDAGGGSVAPLREVESTLEALVHAMPDATVVELAAALERAEKLATSRSSVQRALTRLGYSRRQDLRRSRARHPAQPGTPSHLLCACAGFA